MNREERRDERDRPPAIDRGTRLLGGLDLRGDGGGPGFVRQAKLADDRLIRLGGRVDRGGHDVPRDSADSQRACDGNDPRQDPAVREHQPQRHRRVAKRCGRRQPSFRAGLAAKAAEPVTDGVDREPRGDHVSQRLGRDQGRVDQEERDREADEGADGRLAPGSRGRAAQCVQRLDAGGDRKQPADPGRWRRRARERCREREQREAQCESRQARQPRSPIRSARL